MPDLAELDLRLNSLSTASIKKIKDAWGHRGLLLDAVVI